MSPFQEEIARYEACMERLAMSFHNRMVHLCKGADLTPSQFWALRTIQCMEKTKMSPLADKLGLSMGATSTLIDRLVGRGLVVRCTDAQDRRAVYVNLSSKGDKVLQEAAAERRKAIGEVFLKMPSETRTQVLDSLAALVSAWEELPTSGGGCCEAES